MTSVIEIASGGNFAAISTLAASLIELRLGDKTPIPRISNGAASYAGEILAPWPNRIASGKYQFEGKSFEVPASDGLGNALHGLLHGVDAEVVSQQADSVTMDFEIEPSSFYPGQIKVSVVYKMTEAGLEVTQSATNAGKNSAPVGLGAHAYFAVTENTRLFVPAAEVARREPNMISSAQDQLGTIGMSNTTATLVSELELDHEFSKLAKNAEIASTLLVEPDGSGVVVWQKQADYQMIYISQNLPFDSGPARAVAIEPQTCAVDAFNNHRGLSVLAPGETLVLNWGVGLVDSAVGMVYL